MGFNTEAGVAFRGSTPGGWIGAAGGRPSSTVECQS